MTDRADLIRRLEQMASDEDWLSTFAGNEGDFLHAKEHEDRAALLREAAKALRIEEATRNQQNVAYGPAGKAP
jgi:hypothetical protein